jgi:hypothetical protein
VQKFPDHRPRAFSPFWRVGVGAWRCRAATLHRYSKTSRLASKDPPGPAEGRPQAVPSRLLLGCMAAAPRPTERGLQHCRPLLLIRRAAAPRPNFRTSGSKNRSPGLPAGQGETESHGRRSDH